MKHKLLFCCLLILVPHFNASASESNESGKTENKTSIEQQRGTQGNAPSPGRDDTMSAVDEAELNVHGTFFKSDESSICGRLQPIDNTDCSQVNLPRIEFNTENESNRPQKRISSTGDLSPPKDEKNQFSNKRSLSSKLLEPLLMPTLIPLIMYGNYEFCSSFFGRRDWPILVGPEKALRALGLNSF